MGSLIRGDMGMGEWICREGWRDADANMVYEGMRTGQSLLYQNSCWLVRISRSISWCMSGRQAGSTAHLCG